MDQKKIFRIFDQDGSNTIELSEFKDIIFETKYKEDKMDDYLCKNFI